MISYWLLPVLVIIINQVSVSASDLGCKVIHDFPSCKPGCLTNNGGCPNNINCHQVVNRIYRVNGVCYQALTGCYNCLELGPDRYPKHLVRLDSCDVIADYPNCGQNCLTNYGGCPNGNCHQVRDRVYRVNNKCYQAITNCWGCLPYPNNYPSHLNPLSECKIVHDFPSCKPNCLTNNGGCPGGVNCHQIQNDIYKVNGKCYQAISGCFGCLEMGPDNYPQHLRPLGSCSSDTSCDTLQSDVIFIAPPIEPHSVLNPDNKDKYTYNDNDKYYFGIKFTESDQLLFQLITTIFIIMIISAVIGGWICCKNKGFTNKPYVSVNKYQYDSEQ